MSNQNIFRLAALAAIFTLLAASSSAIAAQGGACAVRVVGPKGQSGAALGHLDGQGKCIVDAPGKSAPKVEKEAADGSLEASAQCRDLSFSYSKRRESACAKHGGVLEWLAQQ